MIVLQGVIEHLIERDDSVLMDRRDLTPRGRYSSG